MTARPTAPRPGAAPSRFERHRPRLLGLAYRMLGTLGDAEDVVQEAWLRWSRADRGGVEDAEAFLVRTVTRLCLDVLKSARRRRETYVGPWLPEPAADSGELSAHAATELAADLSFALLLALDTLGPAERAAFLLHDVFDLPFARVAETLDRSEGACRQLASRARRSVREHRPRRVRADRAEHERLLRSFVAASASGDVAALEELLAADAVAISDGGEKALAARLPIRGGERVARFVCGVLEKQARPAAGPAPSLQLRTADLNGQPGLLLFVDGRLSSAVLLEIDGGRITRLYTVRNPDKLARLDSAKGAGESPRPRL